MADDANNPAPNKLNVGTDTSAQQPPAAPAAVAGGDKPSPATQPKHGKPATRRQIQLLGFGLILLALLLAYLFLVFWPSGLSPTATGETVQTVMLLGQYVPLSITIDVRIILMVMIAGGLGSFVHVSTSFGDYVGNEKFTVNWIWWYLLRPFIGMMLAAIFYLVIRGGFMTAGADTGTHLNPFGIAAMAGLVGMFSKQATDKLDEVFTTLFRTAAGGGDAKRKDDLLNPVPSVTDILPQSVEPKTANLVVTVKGTGFVQGAVIRVNNINRETTFVDATHLTAKLLPEDVENEGEVEVTVFNPAPGGGVSTPIRLKIASGSAAGASGTAAGGQTDTAPGASGPDGGAAALASEHPLTPEPEFIAGPDPEDDESHLDGCEVPVKLEDATPDEELPVTKGGVA